MSEALALLVERLRTGEVSDDMNTPKLFLGFVSMLMLVLFEKIIDIISFFNFGALVFKRRIRSASKLKIVPPGLFDFYSQIVEHAIKSVTISFA